MKILPWFAKHKITLAVLGLLALVAIITWTVVSSMQQPARDLSTMPSAEAGAYLVDSLGCRSCHQADNAFRAPILGASFGRQIRLADGSQIVADREYYRESILKPGAKVRQGYQNVMPPYAGSISPQDLEKILDFLEKVPKQGK